ncbi:hypothetical protein E2C01_037582 [Portunus trituberculatus]|uniref:Uncharacterized protein n=1 Tax=Portunus trituberculatus TaxID=210409 RepID=A0A5B7FEF9_PORTR|nr:hypothetical protein [Portunus trituberculatus]
MQAPACQLPPPRSGAQCALPQAWATVALTGHPHHLPSCVWHRPSQVPSTKISNVICVSL